MKKRMLVMILVGIVSMNMLTGCGKSEEEKAADEIAQHVRDEAAADGVDIDKMIADEKAQYEEQYQTEMDEVERRNAAKVELKDFSEEKIVEMINIYHTYLDTEDEAEQQELTDTIMDKYNVFCEEYNKLRDSLLEQYNLDTLPTANDQIKATFNGMLGTRGNIWDVLPRE